MSADNFENRIGDGEGLHDREYFDVLKLLLALKREGSLLDIGAGLGRITDIAKDMIAESVALEPDRHRWEQCHAVYHNPPQTRVLCQLTTDFIPENPGNAFDVVVLGMVIQHTPYGAAGREGPLSRTRRHLCPKRSVARTQPSCANFRP